MLYNLYRPSKFSEVRGQEGVLQALRYQAKSSKIGHSYLFVGHHGTGKTTVARLLGRAANCLHPSEEGACNECTNCKRIMEGKTLDYVEIDAASNNGVEDARKLIDGARYRPLEMKRKVYIIDEVHMLSNAAFNALLKTLEEPNEYCLFILCTTELHKVPATIISRCQKYQFTSIRKDEIVETLKMVLEDQNRRYEEPALHLIAKYAGGALRDALSLLEQGISCSEGNGGVLRIQEVKEMLGLNETECVRDLLYDMLGKKTADAVGRYQSICRQGGSISQLNEELVRMVSDIIIVKGTGNTKLIQDDEGYKENISFMAGKFDMADLYYVAEVLAHNRVKLRQDEAPRECMLLNIIKICDDRLKPDYYGLKCEIDQLRKEMSGLKAGRELANVAPVEERRAVEEKEVISDKEVAQRTERDLEDGFEMMQGVSPFDQDGTEGGETAESAGVPKAFSSFDVFDVFGLR